MEKLLEVLKMRKSDYSELEEILGYKFKDRSLLDTAFTHKSFSNESSEKAHSYERFEFLGDAILEFVTSKELFLEYPEKTEGELTKLRASLVCEYTLSQITKNLGFGDYLYLSHGEEITGGKNRPSILCDLFESVLGAIYLDGGIDEAEKYIKKFLLSDIEGKSTFYDAKSILQEYAQGNGLKLDYRLISTQGPEHNRVYRVVARLQGEEYEEGTGPTKKMAEQVAAHETINRLGIE
ncbi:MAG TPA: ribonuclease III [Lachnospiraceae bacterium]|jgi:ribonuclease-3|nr:ribonuclease III [Lachnospiraceae bacterium]